jgi:wyosine [tRNA(Phe)-imidazoG37] synthetase (radical SAM superfamily)
LKQYQHIFGPVPSRRLGRSLGVDLIPAKTCSYDCIYCQVGRTTCKTIERKEYVPVSHVLSELEQKLKETEPPDYITLSGSGEPTLHSGIRDVISGIKKISAIPVAVLTNGSLLFMPEVRKDIANADLVLPSLDAGDEDMFQKINRPHPEITFERMLNGLISFREEYPGAIWLEVFLVEGYSDSAEEAEKIARWIPRIKPDRVQLNTAVRPTAEKFVRAVPEEKLVNLARLFGPKSEVIADFSAIKAPGKSAASLEDVLSMLQRRPCSLQDIAEGLKAGEQEIRGFIDGLLHKKLIVSEKKGNTVYYKSRASR